MIQTTLTSLVHDDAGFIISAELVLVATLLVIGLVVGMSQVQHAVATELNDVGHAIGALNQSYFFSGFSARKFQGGGAFGLKSATPGSAFHDFPDACDLSCAITCAGASPECGPLVGGAGFGFGMGW
jgi:hypothetical protein